MKFKSFLRIAIAVGLSVLSYSVVAGPKIEHWITPSGARVYFVENHALPMLDVQVDFAAGTAWDPKDKVGLASLTNALLDQGAGRMDETQIANRLADVGASLSGGVDFDRASVSLRTLSEEDKRVQALEILGTVLSAPNFPVNVFERERARSIAALKESLTHPDTLASRAFWAALYPDNPYGYSGTPESLAAIQPADLLAFYRAHYGAKNACVTLVGDLTRNEAEAIARKLTEKLSNVPTTLPKFQDERPAAKEIRIPHPAEQAHVLIGAPALRRGDPDYFALQLGNYTLGGGGFVSRLMHEVRETRGLAYSVYSYFMPLAQPGPFQIGLQTKKEQADEALNIANNVLGEFLANGPTEEELLAAKQNLAGSFPLRLDSNRKILDNVAVIGFYGLPLDYLDTYVENVEKVTAKEIRGAFSRHLKQDHLITVVVGGK